MKKLFTVQEYRHIEDPTAIFPGPVMTTWREATLRLPHTVTYMCLYGCYSNKQLSRALRRVVVGCVFPVELKVSQVCTNEPALRGGEVSLTGQQPDQHDGGELARILRSEQG